MNIAIIGATDKPDRYAYMALRALLDHGHMVFPVHPKIRNIDGIPVFATIKDIPGPIDTVTLYVGPQTSSLLKKDILEKSPQRIIFNPGAENPELKALADQKGIETINGCTLVMLSTGQF